jgi:PAS domain S-box-containing protein
MSERTDLTGALREAALAVSTAEGEDVFDRLVIALARILGVEFALISVYVEPQRTHLRTLATFFDGRPAKNIEYPVAGTPCEQAIGREFGFHPKGVARLFRQDTILAANGIESYAATTLHDVHGSPIGALTVMSRREMRDGALAEAVLNIFAARVSAEIGRRRSEASYRAIFENAETAIIVLDIDSGAIVDVNPKACATYGYSAEEFKRLSARELSSGVPPYTGELAARFLARARAGEVVRGEWHRRNKDGSLHWDEITLKAVEIAGRPHLMAATREITERKAAVEALRSSEEQYRAIFNATTDSLTLRDADFRIVDVNAAYERMSGLAREAVLGASELTVDLLDVRDWRHDVHDRALKGEAVRVESEALRRDGSRLRLEVLVLPMQYRGAPHALYVARDITERKQAEDARQASEEQYRAIFNATADALVLRDRAFRIVDVNAAYEMMSGKRRAEVIGLTDLTLTRNAVAIDRRTLHVEALAGKPVFFESDGWRQDGTPFVLEVRGIPMTYRGEPHVLYIGRDVTEGKLAERALRASEAQHRAIFDATTDSHVLRDAEFRIVDVNPAYEAMSGRTRAEALGRQDVTMSDPAMTERVKALHQRALAGEQVAWEAQARRKSGATFTIEVRGIPIQHQGRPHVLYIGRDVTEARAAERELRASEEQYRAIFNASFDGMIIRTLEGEIVDVNPALLAMYGFQREDLIGRTFGPIISEKRAGSFREYLAEIAAGRPYRTESRVPRKDGGVVHIEVLGSPVTYRGKPHALSVVRDITERRAREEERAQLEAQLRQAQKMEAIGQLTGGIAHDFNNILQGILGNLVLAEERQEELADPRLGRYLGRAHAASQRARDLIQQMLTFSRGRSSERTPVMPGALLKDTTRLLRPTLPATIELETALAEDLPGALLDTVQFEQVLLNLCINARDAMQGAGRLALAARAAEHRGVLCASCRQRVEGRFLEISVRDSGPGIAPDVLERMFDPFFSTKEVGKGSGMGLAMVHGIVHQHGGHVLVESAPGAGATFRVLIPAAAAPAGAADGAVATVPKAREPISGRVLVADDEPSIRELLEDLLGDWGLEVIACADGAAARDAFAEDPQGFDLVLTDQTMPRLTGLQLSRLVKRMRPGLPVILCTGYGEALKPRELEAAGVRTLVNKPVEPEALRELLRAALPARNKAPT